MLVKEKIIIIFYLNIVNLPAIEVSEYVHDISRNLSKNLDDSTLYFIIPTQEGDTRMECINPILLNEEEYKKTKEKLEEIDKIFIDFLTKTSENNGETTN